MRNSALLLAALAAGTCATVSAEPPASPSSVYEYISTGTLPVTGARHLRVITRGAVILRGADTGDIRYSLQVHAEGITAADAERVSKVSSRVVKGWTEITIAHATRGQVNSRLEIIAPRSLQHIDLRAHGGDVEAYDLGGKVDAISVGGKVQMDRIASDVTAHSGGGEIRLGRIDGSVRCLSAGGSIQVVHAGGESWFETSGGEIYLRETGGPVHASTGGGNIRVDRAGASVSARTAGGRIEVHRANGIVVAENTAGPIQVAQANGVRCETAAGTIRLRAVSGSLRAVTEAGSILAELIAGGVLQNSVLSTTAGDITVFIPSNLPLTVRAEREAGRSGRIISEFKEITATPIGFSPSQGMLAEGSLNGGGPVLLISVGGGTIYLRRAK